MLWDSWTIDRVLILFVGLAFLVLGVQVTLFHYRQNFHHASMWAPVISSPIYFITAMFLVVYDMAWLRNLFMALMWIGVFSGAAGVYYHVRGVGVRVGGWTPRNFLIGPPVGLPLLYSALCVLGLIAIYWRV